MLTQHELFTYAALLALAVSVLLRLQGHRGHNLLIGTFFVAGVGLTGLLTVLELVFWLSGGPLRP